ncbi:MAG: hypothetical protein MN733_03935, partial [Nitrososphaera sp.]|nr:hypothetical protein [Nitrososphaera sp.]
MSIKYLDTLGIMLTRQYENQYVQEMVERYFEENGPPPNVRCYHPEFEGKGKCQQCLGTNIPPIPWSELEGKCNEDIQSRNKVYERVGPGSRLRPAG